MTKNNEVLPITQLPPDFEKALDELRKSKAGNKPNKNRKLDLLK